jgi:hypothetical protein
MLLLASGPLSFAGIFTSGMIFGTVLGIPVAFRFALFPGKQSRAERFVYTLFAAQLAAFVVFFVVWVIHGE